MNLNDRPSIEQFRALLRQHDDHAGHHALWARKDGEVMLTCLAPSNSRQPPTYEHPEMHLRYDTFPLGAGYVGPQPPEENDGWFIGELFKHLLEQWEKLKGAAGVTHLDLDSVAPYGRLVDAEEAAQNSRLNDETIRRKQSQQAGCRPAG